MTDYSDFVEQALYAVQRVEPCKGCDCRENCWEGACEVLMAAVSGKKNKAPFEAAEAYTEYLSDRLCADGKDELICLLLATMYRIDNPPLFSPLFDKE